MANFTYNHASYLLGTAGVDLEAEATAGDLRTILCLTNTTADTDDDATTVSGIGTLDEHDSYTRQALANTAWGKDATNNRSELTADDTVFTSLPPASSGRQVAGVLLYWHVTNDTDSVPIAWFDTGGFPFTPTGDDNTVEWNAQGVLQIGTGTL